MEMGGTPSLCKKSGQVAMKIGEEARGRSGRGFVYLGAVIQDVFKVGSESCR